MDKEDDYALLLAISVCQNSVTWGRQIDVLPDCDYEGWVFSFNTFTLEYCEGELRRDDGLVYPVGALSIGELIDWDILTPISGNFCVLPIRECPECLHATYFTNDYICQQCRSARERAYQGCVLERGVY